MYAKIENNLVVEYPYGLGQLRRDNPNTSFVLPITNETYAGYGVFPVAETEQPIIDHTKSISLGELSLVNGVWQQTWIVADKTAEEISEHTDMVATNVRRQRDELLASCDWMAIKAFESGSAVSADWATYRQALRDVTAQAGFPHEITWPTKPE